eukprot:5669603-Heterocapsa_arctica.AAC.1
MDRKKEKGKPYEQIWLDIFRSGQGFTIQTHENGYSGNLAQNKAVGWFAKQRKWKALETVQSKVGGQHAQSRDGHGDKDKKQEQAHQEQYIGEQNGRQGADKHKGTG